MDKRHKYLIMLDTETANSLDDPLIYDYGWAVIDTKGRIYKERSFVNADIYLAEKELMDTAYYADKLPKYEQDIKEGKRKLAHFKTIRKALLEDMKEFDTNIICAHNAYFDLKASNTTQRYLTKSKYRYFFPYGTEIYCTLRMARQVLGQNPRYIKWCNDYGYVTAYGRPRLTAEIIYRYITGDDTFNEEHTALADVRIEALILKYCLSRSKKVIKHLFTKAGA